MYDQFLRELERSLLVHDTDARARFVRELERRGLLDAIQRELQAHLDRVQSDPPGVTLPLTSKLSLRQLVDGTRVFLDAPTPWRLVVADHHYRSPTAAPDGTFALFDRLAGPVRVRIGRGDTDYVAGVRRDAEAEGWEADRVAQELELRLKVKLEAYTLSEPQATAWTIWYRNQSRKSEIEHVRLRPAMYIGTTNVDGVHNLIDEVLGIPLEFAPHGECSRIDVSLAPGGAISVDHDAPGIPADLDPRFALPMLEAMFTLHGEPRLNGGRLRYVVNGGMHGVGVMAVNALSEWLEVESRHEGKAYVQSFERGWPIRPIEVRGRARERGLRVTFKPDPTIFKTALSEERLRARLKELAYLNRGLRITLSDARETSPAKTSPAEYARPRGFLELLGELVGAETILAEPLVFERSVLDPGGRPIAIEGALTWTRRQGKVLRGYMNNVLAHTGTHVEGVQSGISRPLAAHARRKRVGGLRGEHFRDGLVAVIVIKHPEPQWKGCTRGALANPDVAPLVQSAVHASMKGLVEKRPHDADRVIERALEARERGFRDERAHGHF